MLDVRTVFLPGRLPVVLHLDDWPLVGSGTADSGSGKAAAWDQRGADSPQHRTETYHIDVYSWGEHHVVAGNRTTTRAGTAHNGGRLPNSRDAAVPAVRGVAGELTADAEARRVLVQAVLASLAPDPIR